MTRNGVSYSPVSSEVHSPSGLAGIGPSRFQTEPTPSRLAQPITGLDNDRFSERELATPARTKLGGLAEPALCKMLTAQPSAEARRRAEDILSKLTGLAGNLDQTSNTSPEIELQLNAPPRLPHARLRRRAHPPLHRPPLVAARTLTALTLRALSATLPGPAPMTT